MRTILRLHVLVAALLLPASVWADVGDKLSPYLRQLANHRGKIAVEAPGPSALRVPTERDGRQLCAFVRSTEGDAVFARHGVRSLARWGDLHIALVPLSQLLPLAAEACVQRIEARPTGQVLTDSVALHVGALPAYAGTDLPQAYTGRGVVVGVEDVGFDLTHPNFYSADLSRYRVRRFWDMLSTDTVGSALPVGADYTDEEAILAYAHSRDGLLLTHGTHTLGTAAGSGFDSPYRGMAYESDIVAVSNAVNDDYALIDSLDAHKYTSAMDALGFKYCLDYASSMGLPCVVNFSEGSHQGFAGEDQLLYAALDSMVGPGRIIVASAGNNGLDINYIHKPRGRESAGAFVFGTSRQVAFQMEAEGDFTLRTVVYNPQRDTILVRSEWPLLSPDSLWSDTLTLADGCYAITMAGYPSACHEGRQAYEVLIEGPAKIGNVRLSVEAVGREAEVEMFQWLGSFGASRTNPDLNDGDNSHSVLSPGSAPSVICVGATGYRTGFVNHEGGWYTFDMGTNGQRSGYSSVGPTLDGRTKPDVMAPGTNVISSYSSYYLEHALEGQPTPSCVKAFPWRGRTYLWAADSGTSMSSPVVAGAIALWLEACPTLTPQQAMDVLAHTCRHYDSGLDYPNNLYGHGEIDVYRGLLYLLGIEGIEGITAQQPQRISLTLHEGRVTLRFAEGDRKPDSLRLYDSGGRLVETLGVPEGNEVEVPLPQVAPGVYVLQIDGHGSVMLRL